MRKLMSALGAAVVAGILMIPAATPASALTGSEQLGCYVTPSPTPPTPTARTCSNKMPAGSYSAAFQVMNETGSYSYAWSVPAQYTSNISTGCTSNTDYCILGNLVPTQFVAVSVTITQAGQSATLQAIATIHRYCNGSPCL